MYKHHGRSEKNNQHRDSSEHTDNNANGESKQDFLSTIAEDTEKASRISGVVVGRIVDVQNGRPLVDFDCNICEHPLEAKSVLEIEKSHTGREVALMFEEGRVHKPMIMGFMHVPENKDESGQDDSPKTITAENELLLQCGEAWIHLKKDGDIVINGREVLSRARQNNLIRGGTIHLN